MDNYTDKLAQKFNAQEMIKANAQAEASQMQRLQEQVSAYEAILQDMRKLNYKNSELTDKINELVDESISKVQSTARTEDDDESAANISANLSEAIMNALDEALSNPESSFGNAINEQVSNTLMVPVGDLRESSREVSGSVASLQETALAVKETTEELKSSVKTSVDNALLAIRRENREIADHLEYIRSTVDDIKKPSEEEEEKARMKELEREQRERERDEQRAIKEEEDKKALQEMFKNADDYVHKENLKVYRNVQAVVVDEFKNQKEEISRTNSVIYEKVRGVRTAVIISIIIGVANIVLSVLKILNII